MRLEYIASSPVWLHSVSFDSYLACAYVARDRSTKCIALADAFSPILQTPVDVEAPLDGVSCKGLEISDAPVTTSGDIQLWRAGPQLVVFQGGILHSMNAWLTTLDRAALLVKRFEDLGTDVPRIKCNDFFTLVSRLTNTSTIKRTKSVPWQADVDFDLSLFTIHAPRTLETRPGYLFASLPRTFPADVAVPVEAIDSPPRHQPTVQSPIQSLECPKTLVDCVAYHEQQGWTANTSDIPFDASMSVADLVALYEESMRQFRARTPIGVLNNTQCCMCWKASASLCTGCSMFSLCEQCSTELEGNCEACLFEGQEKVADECIKKRR